MRTGSTARRFAPLLLALSLCLPLSVSADDTAAPSKPNVIVILTDDMGFSDLGCYGGEIHTPNLDALAAGGVRFTQFYNTARCCPTRACILTGLYPHQAAIGHMTDDKRLEGYHGDLSRRAVTFGEALKPAGYAAYAVGKWHVTRHDGPEGPKHNWPLQRGFDRFYGTIKGGGSFYDPTSLCRGNKFITPDNDPEYRPAKFYYTDAISDNAVKFLDAHAKAGAGKPFFMYVAYTAAHWPMHALAEDIARYRGKCDGGYEPVRRARFDRAKRLGLIRADWELTPQAGDWAAVANKAWEARCMEVYAAMVDRMDQGVGRIVTELKRQGQFDNTLIFYLQDNGGCAENMGRQSNAEKIKGMTCKPFGPDELQPQIWPPMQTRDGRPVRTGPEVMPGPEDTYIGYGQGWANVSNTPFREYKHWVHEGGISTPLIAHWPAGIKRRGALEHQPGHLIDIMATCVDVAGAKYPKTSAEVAASLRDANHPTIASRSDATTILPLEGRSLAPAFAGGAIQREALFWEHEGNRAIRAGQWKLVAKGPQGPWELYDMEKDRSEMHDLAAAQPERLKEMVALWERWAKRTLATPWPWGLPYGEPKPGKAKQSKKQPKKQTDK